MASPMVEGRVDPHRKAHFTLHVSDSIADGEVGDYTSVKYNHKPAQKTSRTTRLTSGSSANNYKLTLQDEKEGNKKDVFVFTGQKAAPKKSYILLFDPSTQKATLEPLASTYTFNISSKNGVDISSSHSKIYPRKQKDDAQETTAGADDLFDEGARDDITEDPDPENPYDFRHFLSKEKAKRGDESEYNIASSPDYRTGTGSAMNTPQFTARKPAAAVTSKPKATAQAARPKKRPSPEPETRAPKKAAAKKQAAPPIRLERRATERKPESAKPARKAAQPPSSKIKSAEIVHSSDESDADADVEPEPSPPPIQRSPSPIQYHQPEPESDEDEEMEDVGGGALDLEIEVPDARPSRPRHNALASLGLGQNLGLGYLKSPSNGPISLASAANSVEGSPNPHAFTPNKSRTRDVDDDGVIDFGSFGAGRAHDDDDEDENAVGEAEDGDIEPMDIGPPAQAQRRVSVGVEDDADGDEDDPLMAAMMEGLAGESSEESEEE